MFRSKSDIKIPPFWKQKIMNPAHSCVLLVPFMGFLSYKSIVGAPSSSKVSVSQLKIVKWFLTHSVLLRFLIKAAVLELYYSLQRAVFHSWTDSPHAPPCHLCRDVCAADIGQAQWKSQALLLPKHPSRLCPRRVGMEPTAAPAW